MINTDTPRESEVCWFVGASYGGSVDQLPRFLAQGIWENGYTDKHLEKVRSIRPGERIAIKSSYVRKNDLPFDNRGESVSVMAIKAIGVVTVNHGDGRRVGVEWTEIDPKREWYFYTNRETIWKVEPGEPFKDALIDFAFNGSSQDIDRFRNSDFWRDRFGDELVEEPEEWPRRVEFYEAVADALVAYRDNRAKLVAGLHEIDDRINVAMNLQDRFADGTTGPLTDICPFTVMGLFNRGTTEENRRLIAAEVAALLGVTVPVPTSFVGVPQFNNQSSWLFRFADTRGPDDIDTLWNLFAAVLAITDDSATEDDAERLTKSFVEAFDSARELPVGAAQLGKVLHWVRPWDCISLDLKTQSYLRNVLGMDLDRYNISAGFTCEDYFRLGDDLIEILDTDASSVHSFPEVTLAALTADEETDPVSGDQTATPIETSYTVDSILEEGCFLTRERLDEMLEKLRTKKNVILQGPPGTGKTWLAKRLAYALIGSKSRTTLRTMQFHPNMSYEDFVRGWRPSGDGRLTLVDGPFLETIRAAMSAPSVDHVLVIEEINRGNLAQIFGEMLTLLEADKRTPDEALHLSYHHDGERPVHIPSNVYVIGTMNVADRSLAIVDIALRRRFAFFELEPAFNASWRRWVTEMAGLDSGFVTKIEQRMGVLNEQIADDRGLGKQYRVGHSYVTPHPAAVRPNAHQWYRQVVESEIGPLLDEYWFDSPETAAAARAALIEDL
ncbi:5-methylcytosine-specific restriction protein B [Rhodococcus percolatus]|uniref:McrB family protein n=1 Tax=Rhodococcus opacus TaxID=37919 RepID=UPI0015FAC366|nr:AAA family ATPase [Rhodococcus opacus]MBA8964957.1 5-methylcytosine-specific restriction protein B [Rhodococcus opacus]MBP2208509.1 5-methylcytosine-specific restriction protein B [Rhodococcus opacus]